MHEPNIYYQDIAVGTGATGTAIAAGKGRVDLSAYMTSYLNDTDFGNVRVDYRDSWREFAGLCRRLATLILGLITFGI